jgi:hypothetical protein
MAEPRDMFIDLVGLKPSEINRQIMINMVGIIQ